MKTLNKDEVRKLAPELQKVVGTVEVQRVRTRRRLVERARGYNGMSVITGLWTGAAMWLAIYSVVNPRVLPPRIALCHRCRYCFGWVSRRWPQPTLGCFDAAG